MAAGITILTGIAGSGKTARCLSAYREALQSAAIGRTLWLTPTKPARREIESALPDESLPACFAPNVHTFDSFADRVIEESHLTVKRLPPAGKRRLLRRLVDRLLKAETLRHFPRVATTSGFLDVVESFIAELKRDEIWPEQFAEACAKLGNRPRHTDLAAIYAEYQRVLEESDLYDSEGRVWSARDALAQSPPPSLSPPSKGGARGGGLELIVVDGFSDFTRTQQEILAILAKHSRSMLITLPGESPPRGAGFPACHSRQTGMSAPRRDELFDKPAIALKGLQTALSACGDVTVESLEAGTFERPAMRQFSEQLFANPRSIEPSNDAAGIEILAVTGTTNEAELIAARVKLLLQSGVDPRDVVVATRDLDESASLLLSRFRAAGIPVWCAASTPLITAPAVRALLEVLRLEAEGWPFERLRAVLRSNYFRPEWYAKELPRRISQLLAESRAEKLHEKRDIMWKVLKRKSERDDATVDTAQALELFEQITSATKPLRSKATFAKWAERLLELSRTLGIAPAHEDDERELAIWERLREALFNARKFDESLDDPVGKVSLADFTTALTEVIQTQHIPAAGKAHGRVRILSVEDVRNLDVPHLFLTGLTEKAFPRLRRDDCLYSEHERRELHGHGLPLSHNEHRLQDEMLLFYSIVTRARRTLTLSYSEAGAQGEPQFPSPYVLAVQRLFDEKTLVTQHVGDLDPVPKSDRIFTAADARRMATVELRHQRPGLFAGLIEAKDYAPAMRHVLAGVDANAARFATRGWTKYDGEVSAAARRKFLADRYPDEYQFSVRQFEDYANCRFQFFSHDVLGIEPLEPPTVATDYRRRGNLMHNALAAVHRAFLGEETADIDPARLTQAIRESVAERLDRQIKDTELAKALTTIEGRLLAEWCEAYGVHWTDYITAFDDDWQSPPKAEHFELPFGQVPGEEVDEKNYPAVTFGESGQTIHIRGRIDRIDVGFRDGGPAFTVIDYKSGKPPQFTVDDVKSGRALQLTVYLLAVKKLGLLEGGGRPYQMGYWSLKEDGFVPGIKDRKKTPTPLRDDVVQTLQATLDRVLPALAEGIRGGHFPVDSEDPRCTELCPYNTVCRITDLRPVSDKLGKVRRQIEEVSENEVHQD